MTTSDFKKQIATAKNFNWFNTIETELNVVSEGAPLKFQGLTALHKFLSDQVKGFEKHDRMPIEISNSLTFYQRILDRIESFTNTYLNIENDDEINRYFRQTVLNHLNRNQEKILTYDSDETQFLFKIFSSEPEYFKGAYNFITESNNPTLNNKDIFIGYVKGYEFKYKLNSDQLNSIKSSLQNLKTDFKNSLPKLDQQLTEHIKNSNDKYLEYVKKIDDFQVVKEKTYSDWFINAKGGFEEFDRLSHEKISTLEEVYEKKLKLQKPAEYWKERANELKKQGWYYLSVLVILVLVIVWSLGTILWEAPENIYNSFFDGDKSAAIRWSIVYITFISFMAFAIKAITKVMFSSFHLARDCEERYTLTYFYLSLSNETTIDTEEKKLVMQSLFSRAETGLLKDDGSPTMPNDLMSRVYNK